MNVNWSFKAIHKQKPAKWTLAVLLLSILLLSVTQLKEAPEDDWQTHELELALRAIGHQVLTSHGDSSTPVPPIEKIEDKIYRLNLPQPVIINPDRLSEKALAVFDATLVSRAMIRVHSISENEMVYGFEINHNDQKDIPCLGRNLVESGYYIDLVVEEGQTTHNGYSVAMMSMAGIGLALLLFSGLPRAESKMGGALTVAGFELNEERNLLTYENKEVELTKRELSLAAILIENAGSLVTREYLVEQVWSKDGVVTGRSLDVFISRLRKKFSINPKVQIVNKHGKGYVLKVDNGLA